MTDNLDLRNLQKIILGKRKEPLSAIEIRNLFSYPTTPESVLYIITALNQKKLDPQTTLIQAITNATKKEDLVPISLALRYGADPNLYVNTPSIGDIHILGYTYLMLSKQDLPLLNSVVIMLSIFGSNSQMLIFDSKGGIVKDEFSLVEPLKGQSVLNWLDDQGFDTILPQINKGYSKVDKKFMTMIATFLDKEKLLVTDPRLDEVIGSHANIILNKHESKADPNKGIRVAIKYLNIVAFEKFVNNGATLNYSEINDLILKMKKYHDGGDVISLTQTKEFLLYLIQRGQTLDKYQADLLKEIDMNVYNVVVKEYNAPYWKKICSSKTETPDRLKTLAYQLNLNPEVEKDVLCERIKKILQSDPEKVKKSAVDRQIARIQSSASYINEFSSTLNLTCSNKSVLKGNIYDYPDPDLGFYRDSQDALWCFTSNNFRKIMEQKKNPYTVQQFPEDFLLDVKSKMEYISKYRNIDDEPPLISETLDKIKLNDEITNDWTDRYFNLFKELMLLNNITDWNLNKLSKNDMEKILNKLNIQTNLKELKTDHALKTFAIASYFALNKDKTKIDIFVDEIEKDSIEKNK